FRRSPRPLPRQTPNGASPTSADIRRRVKRRVQAAPSRGGSLPCVYTTNSDSSFWERQACCPRLELAVKVEGPCPPRSSCALGLEVGHASGSNSVRAGDCPVCGGLWRHSLTKNLPSGTGARAAPGNTHRWPGSRVRCDGCG